MLKVAAPTTSAVRKLARSANAITRCAQYFYDIGAIKGRSDAGYLNFYFFARYRVTNKDHSPEVSRYEMAAMGDLLDVDDKALTYR
jgi:hypothetical protein